MALTQVTDGQAAVLDADSQEVAEADRVDRGGQAVAVGRLVSTKDLGVVLVAIDDHDWGVLVVGNLATKLVGSDVDAAVDHTVTSRLSQATTHGLRHDEELAAALGVNCVQHLVESCKLQAAATVVDDLAG